MPKPRKSSVVATVCFSLGFGVCLFYDLPVYILSRGRGYEYGSRVACMVCMYEYMEVLAEVRIIVEW